MHDPNTERALPPKPHCWNGCPEPCEGCQSIEWAAVAEWLRSDPYGLQKLNPVAWSITLDYAGAIERGPHAR